MDPLNENPWTIATNPAEDWSDESPLQPITEEDTIGDLLPPSKPLNTTPLECILSMQMESLLKALEVTLQISEKQQMTMVSIYWASPSPTLTQLDSQ
jgi:hypothetical protein